MLTLTKMDVQNMVLLDTYKTIKYVMLWEYVTAFSESVLLITNALLQYFDFSWNNDFILYVQEYDIKLARSWTQVLFASHLFIQLIK